MENELEDSEGAEEEPDCFVRVTGICRETTEDALLNFFLNTRRSGGGEIKDSHLRLEEGVADITFLTNEVAERVAQKDKLVLDGCKLTATLITAPKSLPIDERSVHVKGMSENTTKDGLVMYMEVVSGEEVENVLFGDTCNAMVMFKEPPDFEKLIKMCSKKSLDGKSLIMEQVNMCDCIEVTSLSPKTTKDAILYYFENSRNGGGDVRKLEYDEEAGRAVVLFDDPSVVDVVIKQDHVIDGAHLTINHYYAFLGEISQTNPSGGKTDKVIKVNPNNLLLIKEFFSREFDQLLQEHQVMYKWQEGSGEIVLCCVETKMDEKTWENSCEAVVAFINQMVTEKITISQEIWEKMAAAAKEKCVVYERQISIQHVFNFKAEKENSIILRGKKTDVSDLAKQLQDLVSQVEEQIMIEKSKITEKIKVSDVQMALISFSGFVDGLTTRHEGLEVSVISDSNDQVIQLRGLEEVVNECTAFVWETLSRVKESEMKFSNSVIGVLGSERGKAFILTSFKNNKIEAIISFDSTSDTQLMIIAMDRDHMNKAVDFLKNTLAEKSIPLDTDQKQLIGSDKWKELKHSIQQSMLLQVTEEPASSTVCIAGIKQEVEIAKERVEEFFDNNIISNRVIEAETGRVRFLFKFRLQSMKNVEDSLKKHSVKVLTKSGESDGKVVVSGTKEGIKQAVPRIEMLIKSVKEHTIMLDAQGSSKLNNDKEWLECLREVEKKYSSVIEQSIESKGDDEKWRFGSYCKERSTNIKIHIFADDNITLQKVEHEIKYVLQDDKNKVAKKVLEWGKHTLDGCPLTIQPKETPSLDEEEDHEQPVQRYRVVRVIGISDKTTKDALLNFFENTRRSGGGEIEDIQHMPDERLADITFYSPDDAERVSQKESLELDGSKLTITLKEIPKEISKDPNKLHVMGISEKTTKEWLELFMEVVSGVEVQSIFFGSNYNAMVAFKEPPDIDKVQNKCSTSALDGSHLKIKQVDICDCIEVTGLTQNTTRDTVLYYFDNPRNGGGEVENVEMDSDNTRALVFFKEPPVVNTVVQANHTINGAKLKVVPFYPFLGESSVEPGGAKKERVVNVDPQTMVFINKFLEQEFNQLLQECQVKYTWQEGSEEIVLGCDEPKMDKKTWENSCEAVVAYINQIVTEKTTVSKEEVSKYKCKKDIKKCAKRDKITCKNKGSQRLFTSKGKKEDYDDVCPICIDGFHDPTVLPKCKHKFCKKCIDLAFQHRKACPTCGMAYGVHTGNMPPGTMNHYFDSYSHLPGYERCGTIRIDYHIPSGTQGPEHPNPGQRYSGTSRSAYLPDCPEGREVLDLLKKAFNARLTFTIGRSVTTGATNVVTWNDIHHKTNPYGGANGFGYPDPTYLKKVKAELADKGIN